MMLGNSCPKSSNCASQQWLVLRRLITYLVTYKQTELTQRYFHWSAFLKTNQLDFPSFSFT